MAKLELVGKSFPLTDLADALDREAQIADALSLAIIGAAETNCFDGLSALADAHVERLEVIGANLRALLRAGKAAA